MDSSPDEWLTRFSLLGLGLALLVNGPYSWTRGRSATSFVAASPHEAGLDADTPVSALELSLWAVTGFHLQDLLGRPISRLRVWAAASGVAFVCVCALVVAIGTVAMPGGLRTRVLLAGRRAWSFCLGLVTRGCHDRGGGELSLHYFTMLYPAMFLVAGLGLQSGAVAWGARARAVPRWPCRSGSPPRRSRAGRLVLLLPRAELGGAVGLPFGVWSNIAAEVREVVVRGGTSDVRVLTRGTDPAANDYPAALTYVLGPELRPTFLRPESLALPATVRRCSSTCWGTPRGGELMGRLSYPQKRLPLPGGRETARVFLVPACSPEKAAAMPSRPWQLDLTRGLRFLGVDLPDSARGGETVIVSTYWQLSGIGPAEWGDDLAFFHHLVDANGRTVTQQDAIGIPSWRWQDGDVLIERVGYTWRWARHQARTNCWVGCTQGGTSTAPGGWTTRVTRSHWVRWL